MSAFKKNFYGAQSEAFVKEVADLCATTTISQLSVAAEQMSFPQLRGYVRAHAWPIVWSATQSAVAHGLVAAAGANVHAAKVLEQTVYVVMCKYNAVPVIATPSPHIGRRAA